MDLLSFATRRPTGGLNQCNFFPIFFLFLLSVHNHSVVRRVPCRFLRTINSLCLLLFVHQHWFLLKARFCSPRVRARRVRLAATWRLKRLDCAPPSDQHIFIFFLGRNQINLWTIKIRAGAAGNLSCVQWKKNSRRLTSQCLLCRV